MVYIIVKGDKGGSIGKKKFPSPHEWKGMSQDERMHHKIQHGKLTDNDISRVIQSGSDVKKELDSKLREKLAEQKEIHRVHGEVFDFRDEKGRLCKEYTIPELIKNGGQEKK